jgi:two-component SAPR family response regulator
MIERILNDGGICIASICKKPQTAVEDLINSKADLVVMDANGPDYSLSG